MENNSDMIHYLHPHIISTAPHLLNVSLLAYHAVLIAVLLCVAIYMAQGYRLQSRIMLGWYRVLFICSFARYEWWNSHFIKI